MRMTTDMGETTHKAVAWLMLAGLALSLVMAGFISYYASSSPDGLESVAESEGFIDSAQDSAAVDSPLSDYGLMNVTDERLSVGLAGVIGVAITFIVALGLFYLLTVGKRRKPASDSIQESSGG